MFKRWLFMSVWAPEGAPPAPAPAPAAPAPALAAPAAPAPATPAAPAPAPAAFAESLPTDLRELAMFKDIKSLDGLARSYANAAKMVGLDKAQVVALPAEGDEAGWKDVFTKLGRPEDPKGYGFKTPEGVTVDPALQDSFAGKAHDLGLSTKQANALYEWWNGQAGTAQTAIAQQKAAAETAATTALKTEWGAAYDQNLGLAKNALAHYGSEEVRTELENSGLGNNPALIKLFSKLGAGLSEDGLIGRGEGAGGGINSPTEAKQQIAALYGDKEFSKAYADAKHPGHKAAMEKMTALFQQAHPTVPA